MTYPRLGAPLTEREVQILDLASRGLSNTAIGQRLYLSRDTVATLLARGYRKLGVNTRPHAVRRAFELGYLRPDTTEQVAS